MKTEIQKSLDENIPSDVVKSRDQGGRTLSYLETWYVIDRLNQILGQGCWGYMISELKLVHEGVIPQFNGEAFTTSYIARVVLQTTIDGKTVSFEDVGYGDGTDKKSKGKAHELGVKEAVSDAIKRAAKNLGRSMGLALYDKSQSYVDEEPVQPKTPVVPVSKPKEVQKNQAVPTGDTKPVVKNTGAPQVNGNTTATKPVETHPKEKVEPFKVKETGTAKKRPIKDIVITAFNILSEQQKIDGPTFKTRFQEGKGLGQLNDNELAGVLTRVKEAFPELKI